MPVSAIRLMASSWVLPSSSANQSRPPATGWVGAGSVPSVMVTAHWSPVRSVTVTVTVQVTVTVTVQVTVQVTVTVTVIPFHSRLCPTPRPCLRGFLRTG